LRLVDEVVLVGAEETPAVRSIEGWVASAEAGGGGLRGVDHVDGTMAAELAGQHGRRNPAGDTAPNDGDTPDSPIRFQLDYPLQDAAASLSVRVETCQRNATNSRISA
jgi:hypothetical protein